MATPVILQMNVHCNGCARKIRRTARNVDGVEGVWASPETGVVVVTGNPDAEALRSRIEYTTRRPVTVVSDGGAEEAAPDHWRVSRMAQSRFAPPPPMQGYSPYVAMGHLAPPPQYAPHPQQAYPYHGSHWSLL